MKRSQTLISVFLAVCLMILGIYTLQLHSHNNKLQTALTSTTQPAPHASDITKMQAGAVTHNPRTESYLNGIIYQLSAEVAGLQYQAYELAKIRLDEKIAAQKRGEYTKPIAIISDIDDTLISDVGYMSDIVLSNPSWDNGPWDGYYDALKTTACSKIPGALEFCNYAKSKGVPIFYITNRDHDQLDLTVSQLQHWGFPYAQKDHVQVMNTEGSSNKTERRANVLQNYDVVMYLGDNIGDFTDDFKRELGALERTKLAHAEAYRSLWGDSWIVLPNATYGDYVGAAWFKKKTNAQQRGEYIKDLLENTRYTNTKNYEVWKK